MRPFLQETDPSHSCKLKRSFRVSCDRPNDLIIVVDDRFALVVHATVQPEFFTVQPTIRRHTCVEHLGDTFVTKRSGDGRGTPEADTVVVVATVNRHRDDEFPHRCDCRIASDLHSEFLAVHRGFVASRLVVEDHLTERLPHRIFQRVGHLLCECVAEAKQGESECNLPKELFHCRVLSWKIGGLKYLMYYTLYIRYCQSFVR